MMPAWWLRKQIDAKLSKGDGIKCDWRVSSCSYVDLDRPFEVMFQRKVVRVDGFIVGEMTCAKFRFTWNSRSRNKPGDSLMRALFSSIL